MLKLFKNLKVINKILLIIGLSASLLIVLSSISYYSISSADEIKNQIVENAKAASNQMTADMMHDALRADVYNALLTDSGDVENRKIVEADMAEHVEIFKTSLEALANAKISHEIKQQVEKVRSPLDAYILTSNEILNSALNRTVDYKSATGKAKLENYKKVFDNLAVQMEALSEVIEKESQVARELSTGAAIRIKFAILFVFLAVICVSILGVWIAKIISKPILVTEKVLGKLSSGEITSIVNVDSADETGRMLNSLNTVISNLENVKEFVTEVGNGNFSTEVSVFNNQGDIYESLNKMKTDLKNTAEEDKKRAWATEGMAKFADILRTTDNDLTVLGNKIISNLVKYLGANQGGIYVINDTNSKDRYLDLIACYAWDKTKHINQRVNEGEGLIGQAWQEADIIHLTEVPQDFVKITSGLGGENPNSIIIVPLTVNEETFGVIEIASFKYFEIYQIDFLKKIAESIASTISSAKINERTKLLLEQSQMQAEQMRAQEEEMRQNMEEMQATQEEMERSQQQNKETTRALGEREDVFGFTSILSESDKYGNVTYANKKLLEVSKYSLDEVMGKPHSIFRHPDMPKELFKVFWDTLKSGKEFKGIIKNRAKDGTHYWVDGCFVPFRNDNGEIVKYIGARYHITDDEMAEKLYALQMEKLGILKN